MIDDITLYEKTFYYQEKKFIYIINFLYHSQILKIQYLSLFIKIVYQSGAHHVP